MLALIPLLPLGGFLVNAFLGKRLPKSVSGGLATLLMAISFVISVMQVMTLAGMPPESRQINQTLYTWIAAGDFSLDLALRLDALSAVMILVVTGIGSLIHLYSTSYMHEETDAEFARFFSYLNLFCFFMLMLVLGSNVLVMFVGWEGVGLCSYLLIGYYYEKPSASDAAKKAFVVNRVGDFAFILGTLMLLVAPVAALGGEAIGSLDFVAIALKVKELPPEATFGTLSIITLLLFIGATGKSAQIPLYVWLPDAMEGPTPVSALIHAATMVTAGVYMIGRNAMLFEHAPMTLTIVAIIGAATALFAGTIGLVQNDIKRVLAYSTVSQLGYMFLAMGVGAYGAGIFHLYTHAFFKACLFLGSGAVIHALHGEQDIRNMGGLKKHIPVTYWTFVIASIAIAGVPGLAGFFSKDEILFETFLEEHRILWGIGILTSLLTATYMFRLVHLTFHGEERFHGAHAGAETAAAQAHHAAHGHARDAHDAPAHGAPHDAPWPMATALVVLAVGSIVAGYVNLPHALGGHAALNEWLKPVFNVTNCGAVSTTGELAGMTLEPCTPVEERDPEEHKTTELGLMAVSSLIALAGIGLATYLWLKHREIPARMAAQYPGVHRLLLNKYYVDELYDATIVQPIKVVSTEGLWRGFDVKVVDGAVNGAGYLVSGVSIVLRLLQNGSVKTYAASMFVGAVAVLAYYFWR
ncbi:MAG: NADH-quinone oxidoreductase subunit L [Cyanobacteria bacterium]|nr:NADH-quinone oxidoreductase subunit L [Cyanobacteriota bacterium]